MKSKQTVCSSVAISCDAWQNSMAPMCFLCDTINYAYPKQRVGHCNYYGENTKEFFATFSKTRRPVNKNRVTPNTYVYNIYTRAYFPNVNITFLVENT